MDVVISPYQEDYLFYGSFMKLLEYMAFGKPVRFPALGQIKEVITDGYNGRLYEPGDHDAMQATLAELIADRDQRAYLGAKARQTIERNWTWDLRPPCQSPAPGGHRRLKDRFSRSEYNGFYPE
jgi:glycosyltransferase involved in cell wall biosynthesis